MAKNRVFISYDYDRDKASKDRLLGWDADKEIDFSSYDQSIEVAVDSDNAAAIKQVLSARIGDSSHFLCIVGRESYRSGWVEWETRKASSSRRSSWPLGPTRSIIRRAHCRAPARRGA